MVIKEGSDTEQLESLHILDEMMENSIWIEMTELSYACSVKIVQNLIYSNFSVSAHPYSQTEAF